MTGVTVTPTATIRNGQTVFDITITRIAGSRTISYTLSELDAVMNRDVLRFRRLEAQREEALSDSQDVTAIDAQLETVKRRLIEGSSARPYMEKES